MSFYLTSAPLPWDDTWERITRSIQYSLMILPYKDVNILPYRFGTTAFNLVATPGTRVQINVYSTGTGQDDAKVTSTQTVIATGNTTVVYIRLGIGKNEIEATDLATGDKFYGVWYTSTLNTLLHAFGKDLYKNVIVKLENLSAQIYSDFSAILSEHFLPYQDLLPDVRSLRILAVKMSLRSSTNNPASERSIRDWLASLTTQTPIFTTPEINIPAQYQDPNWNYMTYHYGSDAHIWMPNNCISQRNTFLSYVNALDSVFNLISASEWEITEEYHGVLERHQFNTLEGNGCEYSDTVRSTQCLEGISVGMSSEMTTKISICGVSYPFDFEVEPPGLYGPDFDPQGNGWIGFPLNGRLDGGYCLDTEIQYTQPPGVKDCCYNNGPVVTYMGANLGEGNISSLYATFLASQHTTAGIDSYPTVTAAVAAMSPMQEGDLCYVNGELLWWRSDRSLFVPFLFGTLTSNIINSFKGGTLPGYYPNNNWFSWISGAGAGILLYTGQTYLYDNVVADWSGFESTASSFTPTKPKMVFMDTETQVGTGTPGIFSASFSIRDSSNHWWYSLSYNGLDNNIKRLIAPSPAAVTMPSTKILMVLNPYLGDKIYDYDTMTLMYSEPTPPGSGGSNLIQYRTGSSTTTTRWYFNGNNAVLVLEAM